MLVFCHQHFCYVRPNLLWDIIRYSRLYDELKKDKLGIKILVENATITENGDVVASVCYESRKTKYSMVFVLENRSDAAVQMCSCDVISSGFTRGKIDNKGRIEPGSYYNLQIVILVVTVICLVLILMIF